MEVKQQVIVKTYKGSQSSATAAFQRDASSMAIQNYFPTSQNWAPGAYGCGSFLVALLLCTVFVGVLVFAYMLIVKPAGTLSVSYELKKVEPIAEQLASTPEKQCPRCAEKIKVEANFCRFCGHNLDATT